MTKILKTIGAILYRIENDKILYLLLKYPDNAWGFVKGIQDLGESFEQTARREIFEETGIKHIDLDSNHKFEFDYLCKYDDIQYHKFATLFLAKTEEKEVVLSHEHLDFGWFDFEAAIEKLSYENNREVLREANEAIGDWR